MSTFQTKEGEISYIEYYNKKYGVKIQDRNQPLLIRLILKGVNSFKIKKN